MKADIIELEESLATYDGTDKVISSDEMQRIVDADRGRFVNIRSGIPPLDNTLGGFEGGELTVVSGPTGEGKTTLCQSLTRHFAYQGVKSVWFSYEVAPRNFLKSFGDKSPMFYLPSVLEGNSLEWIGQRIYEAKLKYSCRAVFIDHLHFLIDMRTRNNMSLEIGFIMRSLKKMAVRLNMCFFLIAHISKMQPDQEPDKNSLRDSTFVSQEADNVLIIWRKHEKGESIPTGREAVLKVDKNRKEGVFRKIPMIKNELGYLVEVETE